MEVKIKKLRKIFIAVGIRDYGKNSVYNFVDFRIKRAGTFNYGGRLFFGRGREPVARNVNMVAWAEIERMVSNKSDIMTCHEQELEEMLEIGLYLGIGPRSLLYYYGRLAITNDTGLMRWPEGPKVIVAVIKAQECACGLNPERKEYLLAKLRSLEDVRKVQSRQASEQRCRLSLQRN